jgi:hypothetical protein
MAKVSLILDTRKKSKSRITGLYPIVLKVFHKKTDCSNLATTPPLPDGTVETIYCADLQHQTMGWIAKR